MMTFETMIIGAIIFIVFLIWSHFTYEAPAPAITGGKALKKITTAALNADIIKSGYNAYKKLRR
jgi:hypothetical protein